jgi:hypothetical protein
MPGSIPDSQGATLSFNGVFLGYVQNVTPSFSAGTVHDMTGKRSPVLGTGSNARIRKQVSCTSVEPGALSCKFWGSPPLTIDQVGQTGTLSFVGGGSSMSMQAFLAELQSEHAVGQPAQWSATFSFTGF